MKRKAVLYLLAGLAASGGLAACAGTATVPAPQSGQSPQPGSATTPVSPGPSPTVASASGPTIVVSTVEPATATPKLVTTAPAITTVASTTAPPTATVSPTIIPPTTPGGPTPVPSSGTPAAFVPTLKAVVPANSGYYFSFAADGRLIFYAKSNNQVGSWAATLGSAADRPAWDFLAPGFGNFTPDLSLAALVDKAAGTTRIVRPVGNQTLATLQNRGSSTIFAPDQQMVAYLLRAAQQDGPEEPQHFDLWVANTDGSQSRAIWTGLEAANLAWFPTGRKLMWTGRDASNQKFGLWVTDIAQTGQGANSPAYTIIESKGINIASLSPDGQWVAYWVTLQGEKFSGVWLARSDGTQSRKLNWQGGFRWADTGELLYVPVRQGQQTASALWSFSPESGKAVPLTDPARTPLKIALDQWQVAPGAKSIVYRNAADNALWQVVFRA